VNPKRLLEDNPSVLARELLEAGRDLPVPSRGKEQLLLGLVGGSALVAGTKLTTSGKIGVWFGSNVLVKLGIGALVLSTVTLSTVALLTGTETRVERPNRIVPALVVPVREQLSLQDVVAEQARAEREVGVPQVDAPPNESAMTLALPRESRSKRVKTEAAAESTFADRLRQEAELVERLRRAVSSENEAEANSLLRRYRAEFSDGQLRPEVSALEERLHAGRTK
jgi:hypothetical protein